MPRAKLRASCDAVAASNQPETIASPPRVGTVFDPFTQAELDQIAAHVRSKLSLLDAEPGEDTGNLAGNWLHTIDFLPRTKSDSLAHIDSNAGFTGRLAKAVVYRLGDASPRVVEYKVGPIMSFPLAANVPVTPLAQNGKLGTSTDIPHLMRPIVTAEYSLMEPLVIAAMTELSNLSLVSYGELYDEGNMYWTDGAARVHAGNAADVDLVRVVHGGHVWPPHRRADAH